MRLSANTGFLWTERPFLDRIAAAGAAGFDAVEFHDEWRGVAEDDLRAALRESGLPVVGLNAAMGETGGKTALPGREREARDEAAEALDMAALLGAEAVHLLAGSVEAEDAAMACYRANLGWAAERAAARGIAVLIEPLSRAAKPIYPLRTVADAAEVIEAVGARNLQILFDFYHVHAEGCDIPITFRTHRERVGHVQIADPSSRHEPEFDGPYAIGPLLTALRAAGWDGPTGCEYVPRGAVEAGLGWREAVPRG